MAVSGSNDSGGGQSFGKDKLIRTRLTAGRTSPFKTYRELTVGDAGFCRFLRYELLMIFIAPLPGGVGLWLRKLLYPGLFRSAGRGLVLGRNVVIRHPANCVLGNNVTIDDNCVIDGRGAGPQGLVIEDDVIINRNCMVLAKGGPVRIGARTTLGANSVLVSTTGVEIGAAVMMAGNCYLSAGAYRVDDGAPQVMDNEPFSNGPIRVGEGTWLGTGAIVLDGVTIGKGAVIGAGAVVNHDVPSCAIAAGVPARVLRLRRMPAK